MKWLKEIFKRLLAVNNDDFDLKVLREREFSMGRRRSRGLDRDHQIKVIRLHQF